MARIGEVVRVDDYDLFDVGAPPLLQGTRLPLVLVEGDVVSEGGRISLPARRRSIGTCTGVAPASLDARTGGNGPPGTRLGAGPEARAASDWEVVRSEWPGRTGRCP